MSEDEPLNPLTSPIIQADNNMLIAIAHTFEKVLGSYVNFLHTEFGITVESIRVDSSIQPHDVEVTAVWSLSGE